LTAKLVGCDAEGAGVERDVAFGDVGVVAFATADGPDQGLVAGQVVIAGDAAELAGGLGYVPAGRCRQARSCAPVTLAIPLPSRRQRVPGIAGVPFWVQLFRRDFWPAALPDDRLISGLVFYLRVRGKETEDGLADRGTQAAGGSGPG
jgi:hypothetical protein